MKKAIILSGGMGSRMGEMTESIPKVMLKLAGKPLLQHNIELLKRYGIEEICLNLHYLPKSIKEFFGDGSAYGLKIYYNYEPELLGTSGALLAFKNILTENFFVIYGDVVGKVDLEKLERFHLLKKSDATLVIHPSSHPEDSDIVQIDNDSKINGFIKKPGNRNFGTLGNAAWYILSPKIFDFLPAGKSDFIRDVFPKMLENDLGLYGYETSELIGDVGTPERFKKMEEVLSK